jgi:hypothetical protein
LFGAKKGAILISNQGPIPLFTQKSGVVFKGGNGKIGLNWQETHRRDKEMAKHTEAGKQKSNGNGLEQNLWLMADKLRKNIDAAEYMHIVVGLIFLKYIS